MTFKRLLASFALLSFLVLAVPAAAQDSSGGAAAPALAPSAEPSVVPEAPAPSAEPSVVPEAPAPPAEATQAETPTTPEGEEQPPEEQPDGEQAPTEEDGERVGGGEGGGGEQATGSLPRTGFEVAALTSIGLGLLLAGAALRPTSSWPPPRDRPSRSTQRRRPATAPRPQARR
jgi:hypothetical protein